MSNDGERATKALGLLLGVVRAEAWNDARAKCLQAVSDAIAHVEAVTTEYGVVDVPHATSCLHGLRRAHDAIKKSVGEERIHGQFL